MRPWRKTNSKCESLYIIIKKVYLITYVLQKDKIRFFQKCGYFLQHKGVLFSDENLPKEDALFYEYVLHDHFRTFWWKLRNQMRKHIEWYLCLAKYSFTKKNILVWFHKSGTVEKYKIIVSYFSKCKSCKKANNFPIYFFLKKDRDRKAFSPISKGGYSICTYFFKVAVTICGKKLF